jgi:hypothetical protein
MPYLCNVTELSVHSRNNNFVKYVTLIADGNHRKAEICCSRTSDVATVASEQRQTLLWLWESEKHVICVTEGKGEGKGKGKSKGKGEGKSKGLK